MTDIKSERWPASDRNRWPASYRNAWPASSEYAGKIRLVFIDPPYNTGSAFRQYDDGLEHSVWLSLMRDRLEIIHRLLSEDGSLWVSLDDNEAHYFKVMCDGIFGRDKFIADISWQKRDGPPNDRKIGSIHDQAR